MAKTYTAQEMREAADNFWVGGIICEVKDQDGRVVKHIKHDAVITMLRQAADYLESEKKYEYAVKWLDENSVANNMGEHREWAESIVRDVGASKVRLVRRTVGEWDEVKV